MLIQVSAISYPCLVIDVGTSRIPKSFDKDGCIDGIEILECVISYIESNDSEPCESNISYFGIQNSPERMRDFVITISEYFKSCIIVAHNAETDIKLILGMAKLLGVNISSDIKAYCTMKNGTPYSKTHVYRGGKKVKKYPHLQELYKNLTGVEVGKGNIYDDLKQCYICFKYLEEMTC
ncbi:hypothetical protein [Psychromonas sp. Urea-02u-13]|uniref:hypothetical protein n=1 Tax=Psychromonas sp. Urea-02u-13 TaxID=2058326 RepID=UPI000C32A0C9|nr:hypothetical protein [Psychromonas sp. Urea-02u-13]PKG37725.1 hypothetical protein CXF74_17475 [Psychromonas sp. Urea-02u-13]